jgi:putative Holliday junction resolvase
MILSKRIASIDYGLKRTGYAQSDLLFVTANPITTFINQSDETIIERLKNDNIALLVIGYPNLEKYTNQEIVKSIEKFQVKVETELGIEVVRVDESFSSKRAKEIQVANGTKKQQRKVKENLDKVASAVILQDFLNSIEFETVYKPKLVR